MKKNLFFAATLFAAMTMAFTACDKKNDVNTPDEPDTPAAINPADYVNTKWRTDSCFYNGERTAVPHAVIEVMKNNVVVLNDDTTTYKFEDGKLITHLDYNEPSVWTIVEANKNFAHLKMDETDVYLSKLPADDMDDIIMEHQASDFVGTWKLAYYVYDNHTPDNTMHNVGTNPGVETWEFKADGTCVYKNQFTGETVTGTWECDPYMIKFTKNPAEGTVIAEGEPITVQPLTKNWMSILRSPDGFQYYYWWFCRVQ